MGKREWSFVYGTGSFDSAAALWAVVERLEALVAIGDALEEVSDLWANSLAFGGQPVGGVDTPEAMRGLFRCKRDSKCVLLINHGGDCVHAPPQLCRCVRPNFGTGTGDVCHKCGFPKGVSDAAQE